ncbi:MAG: hypothetical protein JWO44_46 [Bacteroidetes bacterium]|nr:hypothetical protein [Bacteroidota bacterium]
MLKLKKEQPISLMKYFLYFLSSLVLLIIQAPANAQCKVSQIVEQGKFEIDSTYLYDGFTLTNFTMDDKVKHAQVQFTALKEQHYKLYFCNSGFTEEVKISIFKEEKDGKPGSDLLGATTAKDQFFEFALAKPGNYTVEYTFPTCENAEYGMTKNECMVMLISYKQK